MLLDQCLAQPSSLKLPSATNKNKYRDPQPYIILRMAYIEALIPKPDVSIKFLSARIWEPCGSRGRVSEEKVDTKKTRP